MQKTIIRAATVTAAAAALTFATLAPASAQSAKINDKDVRGGALNIQSAKISHQKKRVVTSAKAANLKKRGQATIFRLKTTNGGYVVLASFKAIPGPDGLPDTNKLYKFTKTGTAKVKCKKLKTDVNVKKDRSRASIPRTCLGKPKKVSLRIQTALWPKNIEKDATGWSKSVKRG